MRAGFRAVGAGASLAVSLGCGGLFGPDAGPVRAVTVPTDAAALERGEYLAEHVMGCVVCHTPEDRFVFGHREDAALVGAGGTRFGNESLVLYASNITPAGIGGWSDSELFHAVTTGVTPDGRALFPIMPYGAYGRAATPDVLAALAYVRSLPAIDHHVPPRVLPGPLPIIVNFMPKAAENPEAVPDRADAVAYGEYLTTIAACKDCHTPQGDSGPDETRAFAGGFEFADPERPEMGTVTSANLTSDPETGIGSWTRERFVGRFKHALDDPRTGVAIEAGQAWTAMPWRAYGGMTEEDLGAIFAYLRTVPPIPSKIEAFRPASGTTKPGPDPVPPIDPEVPRGELGALCDTVVIEKLDPLGLYADPPDPTLVAKAKARADAREFLGTEALVGVLAALPPPVRQARIRTAADSNLVAERCAPLVAVALPTPGEGEEPDGD